MCGLYQDCLCTLQMRARLYGMTMFALSVVLLVFVKIYSCSSYVQTYMGLGPLTIMETVMILSSIYFYMPKTPELMQPMLQAGPHLQGPHGSEFMPVELSAEAPHSLSWSGTVTHCSRRSS